MNYLLHGATLALVWFVVLDAALSMAVFAVCRRDWTIDSPAFWLGLRLLPASGAVAFVAAVFVPGYAIYEPRATVEGFDVTLTGAAIAAVVLIAAAIVRAGAAWARARDRSRTWVAAAQSIPSSAAAGVPAFEIDSPAPLMALVGIVRPRLIVSRRLRAALSPEEFEASVAHEVGHSRAWDNLKRLVICAAPDLLPASCARQLERRWAAAAERAADRHAGAGGASTRCALASALVKVARLIPPHPGTSEPISTLIGGGDVAARVQRLLDDAQVVERGVPQAALLALGTAAAAVAIAYAPLLQAVHQVTEVLVNALP